MENFLSALYIASGFIVVITIVVFVHEMGHFLVARWNKVKVEIFSIGLGKEIFGWTDRYGTRWRISLIPLGGYIKMFGEPSSQYNNQYNNIVMQSPPSDQAFIAKKIWQKIAIVVAGPGANFLFSIVLFTCIFWFFGKMVTNPLIAEIQPTMPAAIAGLMPNDKIVALDGKKINSFEDVIRYIQLNTGQNIDFLIERDETSLNIPIKPVLTAVTDILGDKQCVWQVGIKSVETYHQEFAFFPSFEMAINQTQNIIQDSLAAISQIISGERSVKQLQGIISTARVSGEAAKMGILPLLFLAGFLSVAIGLFNLFPIPLLDGGHLMFYIIELLQGKPLSVKIQEAAFKIGLILIGGIFILALYNDLIGAFQIQPILEC